MGQDVARIFAKPLIDRGFRGGAGAPEYGYFSAAVSFPLVPHPGWRARIPPGAGGVLVLFAPDPAGRPLEQDEESVRKQPFQAADKRG